MKNTMILALTLGLAIPAAYSQEANPAAKPILPGNAVQPQAPGAGGGMGGGMMGGGMMGGGRTGAMMNQSSLLGDAGKVAEFAEYDTNKDGQLSDEEIEAAKAKVFERFKEEAKKYNKQVLGKYDTDKNGKLDDVKKDGKPDSELSVFMKFIAWQEEANRIQQTLLAKFDKDGDGQLTGDEARQSMEARMEMEYDHSLIAIFKECDKNNDGKFDAQELAAAKQLAVKKYDRDHDGKVDGRESYMAIMEAQMMQAGIQNPWAGRGGRGGGQQQPGGAQPGQGGRGGRGGGAANPQDLIKRFDLDGDGKLNAEEQKRANEMQQQQIIAPPIDE